MKPRVSFRRGCWQCYLPDFWATGVWGFGSCPESAYDDWLRQEFRYLIRAQEQPSA